MAEFTREQGSERELIAALLSNQVQTYAFLAYLFRTEVSVEMLDQIAQMKLPSQTGNELLDAGYRNLVRYMNHSWERTRTELAADFLHTFIGNTQDTSKVAYPYESVHTSGERLLMQEARDQVLAAYRRERVVLNDTINEPEDHIAFELEFVQLMCQRSLEALQDSGTTGSFIRPLRTAVAFIDEHLLNWAPALAGEMKGVSNTLFYRALADILAGWLQLSRRTLQCLIDG